MAKVADLKTRQEIKRNCFACDRPLRGKVSTVWTSDGAQSVYVGPDCFTKIANAGDEGFQPKGIGPRLFLINPHPENAPHESSC